MRTLYCKDGVVISIHDSSQSVPASAYGEGVVAIPFSGDVSSLLKVGPDPGLNRSGRPLPDSRPYAAPPVVGAALLEGYANAKQWALAVGGFTVTIAGTARTFKTDPESLSLMTGKQLRLQQANPPTSINWQFDGVGFVPISASDFTAAAIEIADFVQATFDTLNTVLTGVAGGTITTQAAVDSAAWPVNHH